MRLSACCFAMCLLVSSFMTFAEPVKGLYQVRESVAGQTAEERAEALQRSLQTLVLRLGGDAKTLKSPTFKALVADPQQLVSQFRYEAQELIVYFDPAMTDSRLQQAGMAVWGTNRPALMTWWLDTAEARLIGDAQPAAQALYKAAQHRGLPLRLPLADLAEQAFASAEHLVESQVEQLRQASERYEADALLAVVAEPQRARWSLWVGEDFAQGQVTADGPEALVDAVMLAVNQQLAPRYAIKPGVAGALRLEISGVNLSRLAELEQVLEGFSPQLLRVQGDVQWWQVQAGGEQLRSQLALIGLRRIEDGLSVDPLDQNQAAAALRFAWR